MHIVRLANETDFDGWRIAARSLISQNIAPENVDWRVGDSASGLFDVPDFVPNHSQSSPFNVSSDFIQLSKTAILYRDPARFGLLYRLLWRTRTETELLKIAFDPDVIKVRNMAQAIRRDLHKMKAFVRFREVNITENDEIWSGFIAWFEPSHHIFEASAPFFTGRFTNMRWSILTPDLCMHWDGNLLSYSPGAEKADAPTEDAGEDLWRAYYRSIFNPARLKVSAMQAQMPKKYWRNLPEAELIADLVANADKRKDVMIAAQPTEPQRKIVKYSVERKTEVAKPEATGAKFALNQLNIEMLDNATFKQAEYSAQAVLGSGAVPSEILFLGEQSSEQENLAGQVLTGSNGKLLDQALQQFGIKRANVYTTNAIKHYRYKQKGTRRIQLAATMDDVQHYLPWLQAEIAIVQPRIIIAMGAIAAYAMTGKTLNMETNRGKLFQLVDGRKMLMTDYPAYILRAADQATRQLRYEQFVADVKLALQQD